MAKKPKIVVMGVDAAAVNSGVSIIESTPLKNKPHVEINEVVFERGFVHGPKNNHIARSLFSDMIKGLCLLHKVNFVVIEDYAARIGPTNTSAYQHGETVGQIKKCLWEVSMPFMVIGNTQMRSFISVPSRLEDSGKQYIMDVCLEEYGFESVEGAQNRRSNATDAFLHAVMGSIVYYHFAGEDLGEFDKAKSDVLFGNDKKMAGLVNMSELYNDCSWAVFDESG